MAYKLKKAVFRITCKHPGCPFDTDIEVKHNIMGMTEDDVEEEAKKIVKDMGIIKHDAIYGRKHNLTTPAIRKVAGTYEQVGSTKTSHLTNQTEATKQKEYKKGDKILNKGDIASTICEVIKGQAYVDKNPNHKYKPGETFGAAALLVNQKRTADIIAEEDGTIIAFYNLKELSKKDPGKAKELYTEAMEDIFDVMSEMESIIDNLETALEKEKIINENRKEKITMLEGELMEAHQKLADLKGKDTFK